MAMALLATFELKEGTQEKFEAAIADLGNHVRAKEPGVRLYQLTRSREKSTVYTMLEIYEDDADFDAHNKTPHMAAAIGDLMDCMAAAPVMQTLDIID